LPDNRKRLDPWTFGELHPSGMSHVTQPLRPTGRASPSAAAREGNAAGIAPHRPLPIWGHLLAAGKCGAGCRDVCHHRSPPGWRASTGASLGGRLPRSPPRSPPPPPHCHDGRGSAARGRDGATRGLRRGPTPRAASWGCWRVPPTQGQPRVHTARTYSRHLRSTLQRSQQLEPNSHSVASIASCCTTILQGL
jgi:hypothetical protein